MSKLVNLAMSISHFGIRPQSAMRHMDVIEWIADAMASDRPHIENSPYNDNFSLTFSWPSARGSVQRRLRFVMSKTGDLCRMFSEKHVGQNEFKVAVMGSTPASAEDVRSRFEWLYAEEAKVGKADNDTRPTCAALEQNGAALRFE